MKMQFEIQPGCTIEQDVPGVKQAFALVAHLQEVFGNKKCGHCGSHHIRLCHRTPQGYEYFSVKCDDCGHELKFGQQKDSGKLFPKGWEAPHFKNDGEKPAGRDQQPMPVYQYGAGDEYAPAPPLQQQQPVAAASGSELPW